jgi:hypothetical protein
MTSLSLCATGGRLDRAAPLASAWLLEWTKMGSGPGSGACASASPSASGRVPALGRRAQESSKGGTPVRPSRRLLLARSSTEVRAVLTGFVATRVAVNGPQPWPVLHRRAPPSSSAREGAVSSAGR